MTRSGTKRGLAVAAVSALAVVGIPGLAHAEDANSIVVSASPSSVSTYQDDTLSFTVKNASGAASTDATVPVTITETVPTGTTTPFYDETAGAWVGTVSGTSATYTTDVDLTSGAGTLKVASKVTGTVNASSAVNGAAGSASFTVGGGGDGQDAVKQLAVSPTSFSGYNTDPAPSFSVTPEDASGFGVGDVTISYSVDGGATQTASVGAPAHGAAPYTTAVTVPGLSAGSHSVKFWVNQTQNGATPAADAGEPTSTEAITITAAPASTVVVPSGNTTGGIVTTGTTNVTASWLPAADRVSALPAGEADTVTLSLTLHDASDKPLAGVQLGFDVTNNGKTTRYPATTDATGLATVSVPVAAADAINGNELTAAVYESGSATAGAGTQKVASQNIAKFENRANGISLVGYQGQLQATPNGSVSINVIDADQFGKAAASHVLQFVVSSVKNDNHASPALVTTGADGKATFTYTDKGSAVGATDTIDATDVSTPATAALNPSASVKYLASVTPATVGLSGTGGNISATAAAAVPATVSNTAVDSYTATVKASNGDLLSNVPVTFTADSGFLTATSGGTGTSTTVTVNTKADGTATVYAGSEKAGTQTVTATAGTAPAGALTPAGTKAYYKAGVAYDVTFAGPATLPTNSTANKYTATVTDAFGNPLSGEAVTVSQTGVGALSSGVSPQTATTAADGTVVFNVDAGSTVGTGSVTATDAAVDPATPVSGATAAHTKSATVSYTVAESTTPIVTPAAIHPGIRLSNSGKQDIVTVTFPARADGALVTVYRKVTGGFVKALKMKASGTSAVFKLKDKNGPKKAITYYATVAKTAATSGEASTKHKTIK